MEYAKLKDSLDGLFAYDMGCTDSGIHDEELREQVKGHLATLSEAEKIKLVDRVIEEFGWGPEDAREFFNWLENDMDCTIPHEDEEED
jgi:hypothetical protein